MPACPKPKPLPPSKYLQTSYVMVALLPSFIVGVAQWLAAVPTSSPKAHFDGPPPHLPFSARSQHHDPAPGAFDCPHRDAPTLRLSRKTALANKIIKGV